MRTAKWVTSPKNKVLQSINLTGEMVCVDIFVRPDGSFGFDEYRRDVEDNKGWFSIGHHGHKVCDTQKAAMIQALATIGWLKDVHGTT